MRYYFQKHYPVIATLLFLTVVLALACRQVLAHTGGHFCYPLDDTFIHMAIAKNFALHGVWGINAQEFSAASSSPLYTLILAACFKAGINSIWMPFYINVCFAFLLVYMTDLLLQRFSLSAPVRCITLLALVILVPVPVMVASGMEHMLHAFLAVWMLYLSVPFLQPDNTTRNQVLLLSLVSGLAILARFESLFLLAGVVVAGIYNRRWQQTGVVLVLSLVPLIVFGYISVQHGGYFLPNSVLLKASKLTGGGSQLMSSIQEILIYKLLYGNNTMVNIFTNRYYPEGSSSLSGTTVIRLLLIIPALILVLRPNADNVNTISKVKQLACIPLVNTFLHMALAAVGWLFRYEAYLVALDLTVVAILLYYFVLQLKNAARTYSLLEKAVGAFLLLFLCAPLPFRALGAFHNLPAAAGNIYEQQFQMGTFLHSSYQHTAIAANDVGAVSYLSNNKILDLWGLGNNEVAAGKLHGQYSPEFLQQFSEKEKVKIAVVYDTWFDSKLLQQWKKVASWKITNNVICGGDEVFFYAVDPAEATSLYNKLAAYKPLLPPNVTVTYYPIQQ
ncbi:hypothetical protein [Chitinophaga pinensis]|uniref:Uncharacterized protein n=1 Tax=Chitinophaga pinensis (strain ATCC 43595 / DSM 2588 / LMG 13176 / NBRC 15968 / NCIMB 11800 / UQM 2034) TaxID=485918 RepID=A0A979GXG9_CHIPD|nr:hypothetical protein [Chitinophaga pinensis]ACU61160.1 hypothetical protein Cpin_3698 [Chitinophaga pinensis DSM 2588]